jgi:hypothetical protein
MLLRESKSACVRNSKGKMRLIELSTVDGIGPRAASDGAPLLTPSDVGYWHLGIEKHFVSLRPKADIAEVSTKKTPGTANSRKNQPLRADEAEPPQLT